MLKHYFTAIFLIFLTGCSPETKTPAALLDFMPGESFAIFRINRLSSFKSELKNNQVISAWQETSLYKEMAAKISPLEYLESNSHALIAFVQSANDTIDYILATPSETGTFNPGIATDLTVESIRFEGHEFQEYGINGARLYSATQDSTLLMSSSRSLLQEVIDTEDTPLEDRVLSSLYQAANPERSASAFIRLKPFGMALKNIFNPEAAEKLAGFSDWISLDMSGQQQYLSFNGVAIARDSSESFVNRFQNTGPIPLVTFSFAPKTATSVMGISAGNASRPSMKQADSIFQTVEELGVIRDKFGEIVLLNTIGADAISEFLLDKSTGTIAYQDHEIGILSEGAFPATHFQPYLNDFKASHYTILENTFVFSASLEGITNLLDRYGIEDTFRNTPVFKTAQEMMADESSILLVADKEGIMTLLEGALTEEAEQSLSKPDLSSYSISAQMVSAGGIYHMAFLIRNIGAENTSGTTTATFTVQLDGPLATEPQMVLNHRTHKKEIVVQDSDNNLYLISTEGRVLWKKPLQGRIRGRIEQVDLYKNGRLQLAFTTENQFLILDRNGKEVPPFTKTYKGGNLNPLAVFDYDNNRTYRFVVSQADKVYMYNNKGAIVRGFTYTKTEHPVLGRAQHIRFGNRDYLVFRLEDGTLKILNRVGQVRIPITDKFEFSGNEVFPYNDRFTFTDKTGNLVMIDERGKISRTSLSLSPDHGMDATGKSLVYMNDNVLNIKGNEVVMDYGVYTAPRIFYIYDKIYVGITDLQSHRTYFYDSNADPIPGFPVLGNGVPDLGDIDNDQKLELVIKNQENSLVVYRLN
jgi:hypothetical protein